MGLIPITIGVLAYIWCVRDFIIIGKGTPLPLNPPRELVSKGLYKVVRNPIYLGVLFILIGESILFGSVLLIIYTLVILLLFHLFIVYYEEPYLKKKFGESYKNYYYRTPRWIPGEYIDKEKLN